MWLTEDEQVVLTGPIERYAENGPGVIRFNPFLYGHIIKKGVQLTELQYVTITHTISGLVSVVKGPTLFFPGAWDEVSSQQMAIPLLKHQYLKLVGTAHTHFPF